MNFEDWHAMASNAAAVLAIPKESAETNVDAEVIDGANRCLREYFALDRDEDAEDRPNGPEYFYRERAAAETPADDADETELPF